MDFVSLVNSETSLKKEWLRILIGEEEVVAEGATPHNSNYDAPSPANEWNDDDYNPMLSQNQYGQSPLMSKAAEAELYLLATNFLLYVAMVIIITFIAKIYFPELLERRTPRARAFSYRMAMSNDDARFNESYYSSDCEGSESDDIDEEGGGSAVATGAVTTKGRDAHGGASHDGNGNPDVVVDDDEGILDSGGESNDDDDDVDQQQHLLSPDQQRQSQSQSQQKKQQQGWMNNFLEFEQSKMSKSEVLKRLMFCILMLNITFVTWGVIQERMLTRKYPRNTGEYFTYSYALVFTNRFWTLILSGGLLLYLKPSASQSTVIYEYSFPSISNMLSSWCQYEALRYVSFPALTLFKSFKLAPVMAMGKILGNKTYPQYDYMVAVFIGIGITMFMSSTDDLDLSFGMDYLGEKNTSSASTWTGVMLLFLFLFFDSFTSQFQSRMFQRHRDLSMIELMFATSAFSTVLSFVTLVHTKELYPALNFVYRHSEIHLHFLLFSICSTIGQLFIFYTIKNFGAVVFTLIMTTRILLSIALSCILYGHHVSDIGFIGLMVVLMSVLYRIRRKAQGRQLIKWQGMVDDNKKEKELVEEWHEHVDM